MTFLQCVQRASARLADVGLSRDETHRDASLLARFVLAWDEADWLLRRNGEASESFAADFESLVRRRERREPIAYITGRREFYGRTFRVTPDVLIPRPETELLVERALTHREGGPSHPVIADVGTGSGCLAVTIALEWPDATVVATDRSGRALDVAKDNATAHGAADRIRFVETEFLDERPASVYMIVANLPYVPDSDRPTLPPEVASYEPASALFGGPEGLDAIAALLPIAAAALAPGGWLLLEIGAGQLTGVERLVENTSGFSLAVVTPDLQGIPRVVTLQRRSSAESAA